MATRDHDDAIKRHADALEQIEQHKQAHHDELSSHKLLWDEMTKVSVNPKSRTAWKATPMRAPFLTLITPEGVGHEP